jgi:dCTP deaminase
MTFWRGEELLANPNVVSDFSADQLDCNAYTLRMGNCYFRTADSEEKQLPQKVFLTPGQPFIIPPGQFGYLLSKETVRVPVNCMAFISLRTGFKYQGLINVSGFHVDPGYEGKLVYAVYNASPSPVQICENDPVFKIWFASLGQPTEHVFSKKGASEISNELVHGMGKEILSLQSLSEKIRKSDEKFTEQKQTIDNLNIVWRSFVIGAFALFYAAIFSLVATFVFPSVYTLGKKFSDRWSGSSEVHSIPTPSPPEHSNNQPHAAAPAPLPNAAPPN